MSKIFKKVLEEDLLKIAQKVAPIILVAKEPINKISSNFNISSEVVSRIRVVGALKRKLPV